MILDALRMNVNSTRSGEVVEPLEHLERLERWEQFIREIVSTTFRNGRIPRDGAARRAPRRGENSISNDLKLFSWTSFRRFASSRKSSGFSLRWFVREKRLALHPSAREGGGSGTGAKAPSSETKRPPGANLA
jgi:hypothetical protein